MPTLPDGRDERTDPPANSDDAPTATGYPESSPPSAEPPPRDCIRPAPPSPSPAGQTERRPCAEQRCPNDAAKERREQTLLDGLTSGNDKTAGLSVLSDAWEELEALSGVLATITDVNPLEWVSLISGVARRLGAAHGLLTEELKLVAAPETP